jgi:hypothetical protein
MANIACAWCAKTFIEGEMIAQVGDSFAHENCAQHLALARQVKWEDLEWGHFKKFKEKDNKD